MKEIVNVSKNWAIGKQGQLFINIPEDMKFFRETTKGKVCIMGSTTLESFPNMAPLKNRVNIVLIDDDKKIKQESLDGLEKDKQEGKITELIYVHSPEEAVEYASKYNSDDVYVIGGATIYRIMLKYCDTCLVTHNDKDSDGADTFYPDLTKEGFEMVEQSDEHEYEGVKFRFCTYKRTND